MNIYHGSDIVVEKPEILQSNRLLDFGIGFYTTSNKEQAVRWAEKGLEFCIFDHYEEIVGEFYDKAN